MGLTEAEGARGGDGSRLDSGGGVKTGHQQAVKVGAGRDGHWKKERLERLS